MSLALVLPICFLLAYLIGTIPFGLLLARWVAGIDIRTQGSGNIGATNVGRVLGSKWGIAVLLLDCLKGLTPVLLLPLLFLTEGQIAAKTHAEVLCGVGAILGHMFPCWLKFKGGKGVATSLGVILVLGWQASLAAFVGFVLTFAISRIVSLSSLVASIGYGVVQIILLSPRPFSAEHWSLTVFSLFIPLLILVRHRSNIVRLLRGEEPKFKAGEKNREAVSQSATSEPPSESQ